MCHGLPLKCKVLKIICNTSKAVIYNILYGYYNLVLLFFWVYFYCHSLIRFCFIHHINDRSCLLTVLSPLTILGKVIG